MKNAFSGRIARLNYFLAGLVLSVIALVLFFAGGFSLVLGTASLGITIAVGIIMLILAVVSIGLLVRRLHDIGWTGWSVIVIILILYAVKAVGIPFGQLISIAINLFLLFMPGTAGPNKYGPEPDKSVHPWRTLFPSSTPGMI